ncbi:MAG: hypothetical protein AAB844_01190, partial [Patescibacteria group bacterium]
RVGAREVRSETGRVAVAGIRPLHSDERNVVLETKQHVLRLTAFDDDVALAVLHDGFELIEHANFIYER